MLNLCTIFIDQKTKFLRVKLWMFIYPSVWTCFGCSKEPSYWDSTQKNYVLVEKENYFLITHSYLEAILQSKHGFGKRNIRIYHECVGRIEKSIPRITVWHHKACQVMTNGDPGGRIFLSYPHTINGFFFLLNIVFVFLNKLPEVPEYAKMQFHMMTSPDDHVREFQYN